MVEVHEYDDLFCRMISAWLGHDDFYGETDFQIWLASVGVSRIVRDHHNLIIKFVVTDEMHTILCMKFM